jgi:poly-beta-hydroxyalkanoate depolymerase
MEYVVREVAVDRNGTLDCKLTQIVGDADDICIMGRMKDAMKQISEEMKRATREVG